MSQSGSRSRSRRPRGRNRPSNSNNNTGRPSMNPADDQLTVLDDYQSLNFIDQLTYNPNTEQVLAGQYVGLLNEDPMDTGFERPAAVNRRLQTVSGPTSMTAEEQDRLRNIPMPELFRTTGPFMPSLGSRAPSRPQTNLLGFQSDDPSRGSRSTTSGDNKEDEVINSINLASRGKGLSSLSKAHPERRSSSVAMGPFSSESSSEDSPSYHGRQSPRMLDSLATRLDLSSSKRRGSKDQATDAIRKIRSATARQHHHPSEINSPLGPFTSTNKALFTTKDTPKPLFQQQDKRPKMARFNPPPPNTTDNTVAGPSTSIPGPSTSLPNPPRPNNSGFRPSPGLRRLPALPVQQQQSFIDAANPPMDHGPSPFKPNRRALNYDGEGTIQDLSTYDPTLAPALKPHPKLDDWTEPHRIALSGPSSAEFEAMYKPVISAELDYVLGRGVSPDGTISAPPTPPVQPQHQQQQAQAQRGAGPASSVKPAQGTVNNATATTTAPAAKISGRLASVANKSGGPAAKPLASYPRTEAWLRERQAANDSTVVLDPQFHFADSMASSWGRLPRNKRSAHYWQQWGPQYRNVMGIGPMSAVMEGLPRRAAEHPTVESLEAMDAEILFGLDSGRGGYEWSLDVDEEEGKGQEEGEEDKMEEVVEEAVEEGDGEEKEVGALRLEDILTEEVMAELDDGDNADKDKEGK